MNKMRYVQEVAPPPIVSAADMKRLHKAMEQRSWAGVAKAPIVVKGERRKDK